MRIMKAIYLVCNARGKRKILPTSKQIFRKCKLQRQLSLIALQGQRPKPLAKLVLPFVTFPSWLRSCANGIQAISHARL
jgi:hypothetical protein